MYTQKGKLIVLDGPEKAGKSSEQAPRIRDYLLDKTPGYGVDISAEPWTSKEGLEIRKVLGYKSWRDQEGLPKKLVFLTRELLGLESSSDPKRLAEKLFSLFTADRRHHVQHMINTTLQQTHVISDRYYYSTFAYQQMQGIPLERIVQANKQFIVPDLTILIDIPVEVIIERITKDSINGVDKELFDKRTHLEEVDAHLKKMGKYVKELEKAREHYGFYPSENMVRINGDQPPEEVFKDIKPHLDKLMD